MTHSVMTRARTTQHTQSQIRTWFPQHLHAAMGATQQQPEQTPMRVHNGRSKLANTGLLDDVSLSRFSTPGTNFMSIGRLRPQHRRVQMLVSSIRVRNSLELGALLAMENTRLAL